MKVAFLGPAGTYTEEALRSSTAHAVEEVPYPTVPDAVMAVERGDADRAVVPIENSLEGPVTATLDTLAGEAAGVRMVAEVVHPIHHCLIARESLALGEIERVISHPQAVAQCADFLAERVGAAERVMAASTAEAVRLVASTSKPWAGLGSRLSAELYGCRVLVEGVEDRPGNVTRFVWLAPAGTSADTGARVVPGAGAKTSIVFWGFNDNSPGALVTVLRELADRGVNMTKIESRPRREQLGHYMFFADLEGAADTPAVSAALEGLRSRVETLRVLGSYPVS